MEFNTIPQLTPKEIKAGEEEPLTADLSQDLQDTLNTLPTKPKSLHKDLGWDKPMSYMQKQHKADALKAKHDLGL